MLVGLKIGDKARVGLRTTFVEGFPDSATGGSALEKAMCRYGAEVGVCKLELASPNGDTVEAQVEPGALLDRSWP